PSSRIGGQQSEGGCSEGGCSEGGDRGEGLLRQFSPHFFCLGAAFMLLETKSLVSFSLLFGSTWLVNSLVFFAILVRWLLANLFNVRWAGRSVRPFWVALFAVLLFNYFVPVERLLFGNLLVRYAVASVLGFSPIFLANVVFGDAFKQSTDPDVSFASNLLGAMV